LAADPGVTRIGVLGRIPPLHDGQPQPSWANSPRRERAGLSRDLVLDAAVALVDTDGLPLVVEAARQVQGDNDETRFHFGVDALLRGFAQGLAPLTPGSAA
jgi:hypothetical protein